MKFESLQLYALIATPLILIVTLIWLRRRQKNNKYRPRSTRLLRTDLLRDNRTENNRRSIFGFFNEENNYPLQLRRSGSQGPESNVEYLYKNEIEKLETSNKQLEGQVKQLQTDVEQLTSEKKSLEYWLSEAQQITKMTIGLFEKQLNNLHPNPRNINGKVQTEVVDINESLKSKEKELQEQLDRLMKEKEINKSVIEKLSSENQMLYSAKENLENKEKELQQQLDRLVKEKEINKIVIEKLSTSNQELQSQVDKLKKELTETNGNSKCGFYFYNLDPSKSANFSRLMKQIPHSKSLGTIIIEKPTKAEVLLPLAQYIEENKLGATSFTLRHTRIIPEVLSKLLTSLFEAKCLKTLELSHIENLSDAIRNIKMPISNAVRRKNFVTNLNLNNSIIGPMGASLLFGQFKDYTFDDLLLGSCQVGHQSILYLQNIVVKKKLDLSANCIDNKMDTLLTKNKIAFDSLKFLNLSENTFNKPSYAALAEKLKVMISVTTLSLKKIGLTNEDLPLLIESILSGCKKLKTLELDDNNLEDDSIDSLVQLIDALGSLRRLSLQNNRLSREGVEKLRKYKANVKVVANQQRVIPIKEPIQQENNVHINGNGNMEHQIKHADGTEREEDSNHSEIPGEQHLKKKEAKHSEREDRNLQNEQDETHSSE